jgi:hypothetical protein
MHVSVFIKIPLSSAMCVESSYIRKAQLIFTHSFDKNSLSTNWESETLEPRTELLSQKAT